MAHDNWKSGLLLGGGCGGLIGLWTGLWIVGFAVLGEKDLLHPGVTIPPKYSHLLRMNSHDALRTLGAYLHFDLPTHPLMFLLFVTLLAAFIGSVTAGVSRLLSLDPELIGLRSFTWALRSMVSWPAFLLSVTSIVLLVIAISRDDIFLPDTAVVISVVVIPILVCRPAVVASRFARGWWRTRWPGFSAVAVFLALEILERGAEVLESRVTCSWSILKTVPIIALSIFSDVTPLVQGKVLFAAFSSRRTQWRSIFTWTTLGPWIALQLWLLVIPVLLIGPFLAAEFWLWKVTPALASILQATDRSFPYGYEVVIDAMRTLGRFWWPLVCIPASLLFWFSTGKLVSGTSAVAPKG